MHDLDYPAHWYERAEEARTIAETMETPEARQIMLQVATGYRRLAQRAERRLQECQPGGFPVGDVSVTQGDASAVEKD